MSKISASNRAKKVNNKKEIDSKNRPDSLVALSHKFYACDPLGKLLATLSGQNRFSVFFISYVFYGVLLIAAGLAIKSAYSHYVSAIYIDNPLEIPFVIFGDFFVFPLLWGFYVWQPLSITLLFSKLAQAGVVDFDWKNFLEDKIISLTTKRWQSLTILLITLVLYLGAVFGLIPMNDSQGSPLWWILSPLYFRGIWLPINFINLYMLLWVSLRHSITVHGLRIFFRSYEISPKPFHPDSCNGLASIGDYAFNSGFMIIVLGLWISLNTFGPIFQGYPPNFVITTYLQVIFYVVLAPVLTFQIVVDAHDAMHGAKLKALNTVSNQIHMVLARDEMKSLEGDIKTVELLTQKFHLMEKAYKEWPFRRFSITTLSFGYLSPLLPPLLGLLADYFIKKLANII